MGPPCSAANSKKGTTPLLVLALLEAMPRHGYELSKLIESRSGGVVRIHAASLYPLLYALEAKRWIEGRWVEKPGERRRRFLSSDRGGEATARHRAPRLARVREGHLGGGGSRVCVTGVTPCVRDSIAGGMNPDQESSVVEELAQHLEDRYAELRSRGETEHEALRIALEEIEDVEALVAASRLRRSSIQPRYPSGPRRWAEPSSRMSGSR